jgi:hypothetical protein
MPFDNWLIARAPVHWARFIRHDGKSWGNWRWYGFLAICLGAHKAIPRPWTFKEPTNFARGQEIPSFRVPFRRSLLNLLSCKKPFPRIILDRVFMAFMRSNSCTVYSFTKGQDSFQRLRLFLIL